MCVVKVLDHYPQAVDVCMAPNKLPEVDVMRQESKRDDQLYALHGLNLLIWLNSQCTPEFCTGQNYITFRAAMRDPRFS